MVNKSLFNTKTGQIPKADTVNAAGGKAYKLSDHLEQSRKMVSGIYNKLEGAYQHIYTGGTKK